MSDLSHLIKAYDIRGIFPSEMSQQIANDAGKAFVELTQAASIVVAHDMRGSSPQLVDAFVAGATGRGCDVIDVGLGSTDYLYFASGTLDMPGAMFTASHNPAEYNGIKLCRAGALPIGEGSGLEKIRAWLEAGEIPSHGHSAQGSVTHRDMLQDYADYIRQLVDLSGIRPLKVVIDAGNGMAGYTAPAVFGDLPVEIIPMYFELDGNFPNHEANPLDSKNLVDLQRRVLEVKADIGLAFDGDADRCFFVDETGMAVPPSAVVALIASRELARHPGSAVVYNAITSQAAVEFITESGGTPVRSRVGHSYMKGLMAQHDAVFGGEHSGHYYFREFWRADTGMLAALHVLAALAEQKDPLSAFLSQYSRYFSSGELNTKATDIPGKLVRVERHFADQPNVKIDHLDGLTVWLPGRSWFNVRPSNTESLLRVNVEAPNEAEVKRLADEVLSVVSA
jgi:phosphomannomutase